MTSLQSWWMYRGIILSMIELFRVSKILQFTQIIWFVFLATNIGPPPCSRNQSAARDIATSVRWQPKTWSQWCGPPIQATSGAAQRGKRICLLVQKLEFRPVWATKRRGKHVLMVDFHVFFIAMFWLAESISEYLLVQVFFPFAQQCRWITPNSRQAGTGLPPALISESCNLGKVC